MASALLDATSFYRPHYPRFSDEEYKRRYALVREQMAAHGIDCLVVTGSTGMNAELMADVHWLSNWNQIAAPGYVVFPYEGEPTLLCGLFVYLENTRQRSVIEDVRTGEDVVSRIKELNLATGAIGVVGSLPHEVMDSMRAELPKARIVGCGEWFGEIRRARSEEELTWIRRGAELADAGVEALIRAIRPGVTERDLHAATVRGILEAGGDFCFQWLGSTPMSAPRMIYPSHYPSNRPIERGDLVVTEVCAAYQGVAGQVNRYVAVGEPPHPAYLDLHEALVRFVHDVCAALRPGATPAEVATLSAPLQGAGYELDFIAIGRPAGASTPPILPATPSGTFFNRPFVENETVMTLPMPYRGGVGLILGNLVVVKPGGAEILSRSPFDKFQVV